MKIKVKTSGILEDYLPPNGGNPADLVVDEGVTPVDVLHRLRMPTENRYLIAVNGDVIPMSEHAEFALSENDTIAIMLPLKGG